MFRSKMIPVFVLVQNSRSVLSDETGKKKKYRLHLLVLLRVNLPFRFYKMTFWCPAHQNKHSAVGRGENKDKEKQTKY